MKLLAILAASAHGQSWNDLNGFDVGNSEVGKFGSLVIGSGIAVTNDANPGVNVVDQGLNIGSAGYAQTINLFQNYTDQTGHGGNRRFCHTTGRLRAVYQWNDSEYGGYFYSGRARMECVGEELFCFIEERAQFGQIISITAGCEQMMNHPMQPVLDAPDFQSSSWTQRNQIHNNYNQEAAAGRPHGSTNMLMYKGIGGCLAHVQQNGIDGRAIANGSQQFVGALSVNFYDNMILNIGPHDNDSPLGSRSINEHATIRGLNDGSGNRLGFMGNYGLNQCLRFPRLAAEQTSAGSVDIAVSPLLPFGVSVCRACCIAQMPEVNVYNVVVVDDICNYPPVDDYTIDNLFSGTNDQTTTLVPRFDAAHLVFPSTEPAYGPTTSTVANNLFVHAGTSNAELGCRYTGGVYNCAPV